MKTLNNFKIGAKLTISFAIIAILLIVVAAEGFISIATINNDLTMMYDSRLIPITSLTQADASFYKLRGDVYKFVLLPSERIGIEAEISALVGEVDAHLKEFGAQSLSSDEKTELTKFEQSWAIYQKAFVAVMGLARAGNDKEVLPLLAEGGALSTARLAATASMDKLVAINRVQAESLHNQGDATQLSATLWTLVLSAVAILLTLAIGSFLTRSTAVPLAKITDVAIQVGKGNMTLTVPVEARADEVGMLAEAFRQMLENLRRNTMDISEGKRLEEELRGSAQYTRNLIEASLDPLVTIGPDGKITDANSMTEQVTGVPRERLVGSDFANFFTEPDKARTGYQLVFSQGMVKDYPLSIRHINGRITDVLYNASVYRNAAGAVQGIFASARDVTDRKQKDDELRTYREQLEDMVKRRTAALSQVLLEAREITNVLVSSASEILAATTQVASSSAETAASINETTTTVEEVRQAAQLSSQKAQNVSDNAMRIAQVSQNGLSAVQDSSIGMNNTREQMELIAQTIVRLSEQSQSIGGIIASVTDLANQSNILAVNAAIEAARAGEQGKGFSVVAQEIKSLAEQSKQATAQVRNILSDVQKATNNAVIATEQGSKAVESGVRQSALAGESIRALTDSSGEAVQAAVQIVASSKQQVLGMDQIGVAMESINQAGAQNASSMKQMEVAAQNLHQLGQKLKDLIEQFKV